DQDEQDEERDRHRDDVEHQALLPGRRRRLAGACWMVWWILRAWLSTALAHCAARSPSPAAMASASSACGTASPRSSASSESLRSGWASMDSTRLFSASRNARLSLAST